MSFNLEFVRRHAQLMRESSSKEEEMWHKKLIALNAQLMGYESLAVWPDWADEIVQKFLEAIDV